MAFNTVNHVIELAMNKQIFGTENNCSLSKCPFAFHSLNPTPLKCQDCVGLKSLDDLLRSCLKILALNMNSFIGKNSLNLAGIPTPCIHHSVMAFAGPSYRSI